MKLLIFGATGLVGTQLTNQLISTHEVHTAVRKLGTTKGQEHLLNDELIKDNEFDGVYCCLGTTIKKAKSKEAFKEIDYKLIKKTYEYSKKNKASFFCVISALGADSNSKVFYNKIKGQLEDSLEKSSMKIIIVRPSLLVGEREEFRIGEYIGIKIFGNIKKITPKRFKHLVPIRVESVAKSMVDLSLTGSTEIQIEYKII